MIYPVPELKRRLTVAFQFRLEKKHCPTKSIIMSLGASQVGWHIFTR